MSEQTKRYQDAIDRDAKRWPDIDATRLKRHPDGSLMCTELDPKIATQWNPNEPILVVNAKGVAEYSKTRPSEAELLCKLRAMQQVMLERDLNVQQQLDALHARVAELEQRGKDVSRPAE